MTEIDDEMIRRFREASGPYLGLPKPPGGALVSDEAIRAWKKEVARGILEKTLNPPPKPEPEIEVSEGMQESGLSAYWHPGGTIVATGWNESARKQISGVYRAMESTRLKEAAYAAKSAPQFDYGDAAVQTKTGRVECDLGGRVSSAAPVKETGGGVGMVMIKDRRIQLERRTGSDSYSDLIARLSKYGRERRHGLKRRSTDQT